MSLTSLQKRLDSIEETKKALKSERFKELRAGLSKVWRDQGYGPRKTQLSDWLYNFRNTDVPDNVVIGGIYAHICYKPEYLEWTHLKDIPNTIDEESKAILKEKYNIVLPDRVLS